MPDSFDGARQIRELRDKAKDGLKIRIERMLGEEVPPYLSLCGVRGLKQLAQELEASHPEVSAEIQRWAIHDEDLYRVTRKLSDLLGGRIKRATTSSPTISVVGNPSAASNVSRSRRIF